MVLLKRRTCNTDVSAVTDAEQFASLLANNRALADEVSRLRHERYRFQKQIDNLEHSLAQGRLQTSTKDQSTNTDGTLDSAVEKKTRVCQAPTPTRMTRSNRAAVSYAEPSLKAKLRQQ